MRLSDNQKKIVDFDSGAILVKAGPGSGKTRVVIERIKKILNEKKNVNILALTFSNMAADEMKSRVEESEEIAAYTSNVTIGTLHSFCMEMLQKRYSLIGFEDEPTIFESDKDRKKILIDIFEKKREWKGALIRSAQKSKVSIDRKLEEYLTYISELKRQFIYPEMYNDNELFKGIYKEYCEDLFAQNALDFDDILFYSYKILSENPNVVKMYNKIYKYFFVDEAQDLNYSQYMVIKTLCDPELNPNIMMVGDENQSIYAFNGSNSDIMIKDFVKDYSPQIFELYENFRSAKSIVKYANKLEQTESETNFYYDGELKFYSFETRELESLWVVDNIKYLINKGHNDIDHKLDFSDFAIIARNRYLLDSIATVLENNNIPFYFKKNNSGLLLDSEMINVFDICIRLVINPKDIIHKKQLFAIINLNFDSALSVEELLGKSKYKFLYSYIKELENGISFDKVAKKLKKQIETDFKSDEKELIINDLNLYLKHWKKYTQQVDLENRTLSSFRSSISLGKTSDENNLSGVALLTVHMSKGLQYEVVNIIGCSEGTFPDYRSVNSEYELKQEKNNMFVAVTRAKRLCYISYAKRKMMPWGDLRNQYPSRFISAEIIEEM